MWVFLNDSFLSIVADRDNDDALVVRARVEGDLERAFGSNLADLVEHTPDADYPFRMKLSRVIVGIELARRAELIDYDNFKKSVGENDRHDSYLEVWSVMRLFGRMRLGLLGRRRLPWEVLAR